MSRCPAWAALLAFGLSLRFSAHAKIYTFTANNKGQINHRSKTKILF